MTNAEIIRVLAERGETLSCAESLTGGLLSDALVSVPGASKAFIGGVVAYDEGRKVTLLGVSPQALQDLTAVSAAVAYQMAAGACARLQTDHALATTGYAGPDGDDVGLVYVSYAGKAGPRVRECRFSGDRGQIRAQSVQAALDLLSNVLTSYK